MSEKNQSSAPTGVLAKEQLGVWGIVFFVVAAAAPLVGMTGAFPIAAALGTGAAAPGAYLMVGLTLLLFSVGYAAMSQQVTNAGAFFAYIGKGLGRAWGMGSAYVSLLAYLSIQLAIFGFFGAVLSSQVPGLTWWAASLIAWLAVTVLSLFKVDVGAKLLGVLMVLEVLCLLITSLAILINGGPEGVHFWASFNPSAILAGGLNGSAGIAFAFAFASFIGFEATAIYGEESKNPKQSVPKATYLAVLVITALFAITSFAIITGLGNSTAVDKIMKLSTVNNAPLADPAAVLFSLATQYVGQWMADVMGVLVLSSLFAGLLAFQNSASRYFFALSRAGALPSSLSHVNLRGAPSKASIVTSVLTGLVIIIFAVTGLDPVLNLFYWTSAIAVVAIVLIEILVCLAVMVYFSKSNSNPSLWKVKIAPFIAAIGLILGEYLLMSRFGLLAGTVAEGVDPTTTAWGLSGLGWCLVLSPFVLLLLGVLVNLVKAPAHSSLAEDVLQ